MASIKKGPPRGNAGAPRSSPRKRVDTSSYSPPQAGGFPSRNIALKRAIDAAFAAVGLAPDFAAGDREALPAATFDEQLSRALISRRVVALARGSLPITVPDRELIHRLVDHACAMHEVAGRATVAAEALAGKGGRHGR